MSAHTPGPWTVGGDTQFMNQVEIWPAIGCAYGVGPEVIANAHLIAAAPDLLDALESAVDCGMVPSSSLKDGGAARHARQVHVADMIRAAIAKAKGETQ